MLLISVMLYKASNIFDTLTGSKRLINRMYNASVNSHIHVILTWILYLWALAARTESMLYKSGGKKEP